MIIVDAHLDLAYNALRGRDLARPALDQPRDAEGTPSVSIPDLLRGGVGLICGTIFCEPAKDEKSPGYRTPEQAAAIAAEQVAWYRRMETDRHLELIIDRASLALRTPSTPRIAAIILMEGADPIQDPADLERWHALGVRAVGLAWKRTRYAGGTGAPGGLTPEGIALVPALDAVGMIHDVSHLAEQSFWDLLRLARGPVMASHSNCRAIVPTDRQLSDDMIRAIVDRDGIIGINFYDRFLLPPVEYGRRRASIADVVRHIRHICTVAGDVNHVGLGTDMDGGLGAESIPAEIRTSADLPRIADALAADGFAPPDVDAILGGNWLRFFRSALP